LRLLRGFIHAVFAYPDTGATMKEIEAFHSALTKASHETSHFMSSHLRAEASESGWPSGITNRMNVRYGNEGFEAHVHDAHYNAAHGLEYGTPDTQPTAAVRRFGNRTQEAEKFLLGRLSTHLGDL
jgi:hypothetical protein